MNLIEMIAKHLEFCEIGVYASQEEPGDIFFGHMPDEPDNAVCVFSSNSGVAGSDAAARVQIMTRGPVGDVRTPYERACAITGELDGFSGYLCGDGPYARFDTVNSAQGMGMDDRGRELYTSNYTVAYCDMD